MRRIRSWAIPLLCAVLTLLVFKTILFIGFVPSASMEASVLRWTRKG